jgi:methyl-accepting chemotaxis protein
MNIEASLDNIKQINSIVEKEGDEIVTAVSHINDSAQSTSAASEELSASPANITDSADKLKTEISFFKI